MDAFTCTLLADGSSDRVLEPILRWLLDRYCPRQHALDFAPAQTGKLAPRLSSAMDDFPCDLLFVHRDAEGETPSQRQAEIDSAWSACVAGPRWAATRLVSVIPVRMTEAWLLFDEAAIRAAAGNPNGKMPLNLPPLAQLEQQKDPKERLFETLKKASGLSASRLKRFAPEAHRHRVTELTEDFSPLRILPSFARLEAQMRAVFQS